jgi:hypothetical protein
MKNFLSRIKLFFVTMKKRRELKEEDPYIYK